jgi:hypothetical protein
MASSKTFSGVTLAVLKRMQAGKDSSYSITLRPDGRSGVIAGKSPVGDVVIGFDYEVEQALVTLTVMEKPIFVPLPMIWAEVSYALREAARGLEQIPGGDSALG